MPRIRTIKPSFWDDEQVMAMCHEARLLLIGLVSMADDDGRFLATPAAICGYLYPGEDLAPAKVKRWLAEVSESGIAYLYESGGLCYGCFPNWHKHQKMNRYTASKLPPPDVECAPRGACDQPS